MTRKWLMICSTGLLAASGVATALFGKGVCILEPDCSPLMVGLVLLLFIASIITFGIALDFEAREKHQEAADAKAQREKDLEEAAKRGAVTAFRALANMTPEESQRALQRLGAKIIIADDNLLQPEKTLFGLDVVLIRAGLALALLVAWVVAPLLLTGDVMEIPFTSLSLSERHLGMAILAVIGLSAAIFSFRNIPKAAALP